MCAAFAWDLHDCQAPEQLSRGPLRGRFVCLAVVLSGVLYSQARGEGDMSGLLMTGVAGGRSAFLTLRVSR